MNDEQAIWLSAVRYSLPRKTVIVGLTVDFMISKIPIMSDNCLIVMARDIREAEEEKRLGDDCDKQEWLKLFNELCKEIKRREKK